MADTTLNHLKMYRMPFSLADNAISWLEPTSQCNLACDGCYRENIKNAHKSLEEVKHELDIFQQKRNTDCISIAGGDPLLHPQILDIVSDIKRRGLKPVINTNGLALKPELLKELKRAGVYGFTFHVDSKQGRPAEWRGKSEIELNELRYHYARMLADEGGIACSFNSTVYEDTLQHVPALVKWASENIDIVQTMVFISFRHVVPAMPFDWYAGGRQVEWQSIKYHSDNARKVDMHSTDLVKEIQKVFPDFAPSAYLNGTEKADSFKWLVAERIGTKKKIYGYVGPKFMELMMAAHHFFKGKYISYLSPSLTSKGRLALLFLWPFDKGLRNASAYLLKNPLRLFFKTYFQNIAFIQPIDFLPDGRQSMCDGCPDMTVWKDELVWSCRLEELKNYGTFIKSVPKAQSL
jgi:pyruvate-formate lyase-activating enzyme